MIDSLNRMSEQTLGDFMLDVALTIGMMLAALIEKLRNIFCSKVNSNAIDSSKSLDGKVSTSPLPKEVKFDVTQCPITVR